MTDRILHLCFKIMQDLSDQEQYIQNLFDKHNRKYSR